MRSFIGKSHYLTKHINILHLGSRWFNPTDGLMQGIFPTEPPFSRHARFIRRLPKGRTIKKPQCFSMLHCGSGCHSFFVKKPVSYGHDLYFNYFSANIVNSPGRFPFVHAGCSSNLLIAKPLFITALMISLKLYLRYLHNGTFFLISSG